MTLLLVGAGGHARAIAEALESQHVDIDAYVDARRCLWLSVDQFATDEQAFARGPRGFVLGLGGVDPPALRRRLEVFESYREHLFRTRAVVHPSANVSPSARMGNGALVLAGAIVQPGSAIGDAAIVNTGAIIEHDAVIGEGAHVAPGAVVLGGARVGTCSMIGAGAVILPMVHVPDDTLVPASSRWPSEP